MIEQALIDGEIAADVHRIELGPGERSDPARAAAGETLLYVSAGFGRIRGDGAASPLAPESVAWLEPGEPYVLEAGEAGLELLLINARP